MNLIRRNKPWTLVLVVGGILSSCTIDQDDPPDTPVGPTPYALQIPANFPSPTLMESNPLTEEGVLLGKTLFFDTRLSINGQVSCASCHLPSKAFSDGVAIGQHGVSGMPLDRHSPALINVAWMDQGLFWDGGSKNLESQAFGPLSHADEMGMTLMDLELRLIAEPDYVTAFEAAFEDGVSAQNVAKALAQYQRTLISGDSRYDKYIRSEPGGNLTHLELQGKQLVQNHCGACHKGELFSDYGFHNNGLDKDFSDLSHEMIRLGRYRISFREEDKGAYKTPTLRNIAATSPYMHDGRFENLEQVLDHYISGVKEVPTTSSLVYQNEGKAGIPLSSTDRIAILAFLNTLTDSDFLASPDLIPN